MKTRSSICCKQWCLYNDSEHLIPVKGRLYNLINAHRQNKFNYLSEFLNPEVCQYSVKNLKIHQKCYNDLSKSFCSFNKIEINGKKYFCGKRFYECDLIGGATLKLARMFNINLTSDLICSRHKRLLSNLKIKKLYPRVKKENKTQENQKYLNVDDLSGSIDCLEEYIHDKEGYYFQGDQIIETITISDTEVSTDSESNSEIEELNSDFTISNTSFNDHSKTEWWREMQYNYGISELLEDTDDDSDYVEILEKEYFKSKIDVNLQNNKPINKNKKKKKRKETVKNKLKEFQIPKNKEDINQNIINFQTNLTDFNSENHEHKILFQDFNKSSKPQFKYFSKQPRLKYSDYIQEKSLQKDLFEWKIRSNTPNNHFCELIKIIKEYCPDKELFSTPKVIRKQILNKIGYYNVYNYYHINETQKSPRSINTVKLRWDKKLENNVKKEHTSEVPYITITTWLDLILQSKLKNYLLNKKDENSNKSVDGFEFQPMEFFDTEKFKKIQY
ncbi:hypothetical protein M0812_16423 [Anaeramoeba flamelloides]|uniref:Uncharacterized protein n=1 Tax=Anaeramoeba flamelloides TaxID=1746091 RepID=A0AAV7ZK50_9EUKA|nr:hypothetical protein M0812_16423 [Anaeramoeba flamelloides]